MKKGVTKANLLKEIERKTEGVKGGSRLTRDLLLDDLRKKNKPKKALEYVNRRVKVSRRGVLSIS
jgi:hypothetical protein